MNSPLRHPAAAICIGVVAALGSLVMTATLAGAANTSFNVTNVVTAVNAGTCPANFLGSLAVGQSSNGASTLDITGTTATQTLASNGLVLTGPVNGNVVSVSVERPVTSGSTTFTERRESTFTIDGTAATGSSRLTVTFPNGGTCGADFALTGTLGAALIPEQATTTVASDTTAAASTIAAPTTLPATGLAPSTIILVGALVAATGGVVLLVGRQRAGA